MTVGPDVMSQLGGGVPEDPYYARLRAAQSDPAVLAFLQEEMELAARLAQSVDDGTYAAPSVEVLSAAAPGPHGPVPVRVYLPSESGPSLRPIFVWCHGGGWCEGDLDMHEADATAREVASRAGAVVVSVGYRLAREGVHYPVPLDDVLASWRWALDSASQWQASADRAVLGGASAGGNLAAGAALRLRDEGGRQPAGLALVYPALHGELPVLTEAQSQAVAMSPRAEGHFRRGLVLMLENYLGSPLDEAPLPAVPALAELAGLPPALVITCEWDLLRSSGEAFAAELECAGVPHRLLIAPGVGHGHLNSPWLPEAQRSYQDLADWVMASTALPISRSG